MFIARTRRVNPNPAELRMEAPTRESEAERRANELYWGSDASVNQIAEELDLSKSALYGIIRPLSTGLQCPVCGGDVLFPNRTARQKDRVTCGVCSWEGTEAEAVGGADDDESESILGEQPRSPAPTGGRSLAGGALLGAALGLALILWARRRG